MERTMNLTLAAHQFQRTSLRLAMVAAALMVTGGTALADEPICAPRKDTLKVLADKYGEVPVAAGLSADGVIVEVLASDGGATFTIILTAPDGTSCFLTAGENWSQHKNQASLGQPS
jgi:hypothetical protein